MSLNAMATLKGIPGPLRLPVIGSLYLYKFGKYRPEKYHQALVNLYKTYGPVVRVQFGPASTGTIIHLFDPDDAEYVHSKEGKMPFIKPLQATVKYYRKVSNNSPGLGNSNGEEWYRLRSAVRQVMLRPQEVQTYLPVVNSISDEMITRIRQKRNKDAAIEDLRSEISKWSREVAGTIGLGRRLGSFDGGAGEAQAQQVINANRIIFQNNAKLEFSLPFYQYFTTPSWRRIVNSENFLTQHCVDLVEKATRENLDKAKFLQYLLSRDDLSYPDAIILTMSMLTDGLSTVVPSLMCCAFTLASNPKIQEEVYEEVRAAVGNGPVTVEALAKIPLLKAVVKETFRMYPNGIETDRIIQTDLKVGGYFLPAGTNVTMNQVVHFRSEKYFENPDKFLPHRWLRDNSTSTIHSHVLMPFGSGARHCVGRRFAEQDMYTWLIKILLNFQLKVPKDTSLELIYETLLCPQEPLLIQFHVR